MATLTVIFSGIFGFVERTLDTYKAFTVLAPKVGAPQVSANAGKPILPRHYAFLRFEPKYLGASQRVPDFVVERYGTGVQFNVLYLDDEELTFKTGNSPAAIKETYDSTIPNGAERPDPLLPANQYDSQKRDFRWLLNMDRAYPDAGIIDPECLALDRERLIESRCDLREGEIGVHSLAGDQGPGQGKGARLFAFGINDPQAFPPFHRQALSEEIVWSTTVSGNVSIVSQRLRPDTSPKPNLVLKPDGGKIELFFQNAELEEIVALQGAAFETREPEDFELLYDLCDRRPPLLGRRTPAPAGGGGGPAGERLCTSGRYRG